MNRLAGKSGSHAGHSHAGHGHAEETLTSVSSAELIADSRGDSDERDGVHGGCAGDECLSEKDCKFVASEATTPAKKRYTGLKMGLMSGIFAMGLAGGMLPLLVTITCRRSSR